MKRLSLYLLFLLFLVSLSFEADGADSIVVFNEVNYRSAPGDTGKSWVELHNQMAIDIDLSAWSISGNTGFSFAEGTIIPGGGYLVVAHDPAALQARTGVLNIIGPLSGGLNNSSGVLRLWDRNHRLMDEMEYRDGGKWPVAPDGSGATLAKANPDTTSAEPGNWTSSVVAGGTPGRANFAISKPPQRRTLLPFTGLWRYEASGTDLGTAWKEPGFDDSAWAGRNNATLLSYWPFDGNATAARGVNGTFAGAVTTTTDRNGNVGGALGFSGSEYVSVAGGGGLNAAPAGTVSMWVKWSGTQDADCCGTFGAVLARQANGQFSDDILALNTSDPGVAHLVWRQSGGPAPALITSSSAVGTNWHHIAVTFSSGGSVLYMDGLVEGTATGAGMNNNSSIPLSIGAWAGDGAGFATASIDDVAIWDQPLSAAQVAQLAAQTKIPLDFSIPESAVYYAGDGRLIGNDSLRRTALPLGPTTYYFRSSFVSGANLSELKMDLAVDDGAVVYMNGTEVYRRNMPAGPIGYAALASSEITDTPIITGISLPTTSLVDGTNNIAIEVHQAASPDNGMVFGAGLTGTIAPAPEIEVRLLVQRHDSWKFSASGVDPGSSWRDLSYNDNFWDSGAGVFFAGSGEIDGVPPEKISGVTVSASSEYVADGRLAAHLVDGSGLLGNAHGTTPGGTMWLNNGTLAAPNDLNPQLTFDLGSTVPLRLIKVWNYNEDIPGRPELLSRGTSSADILLGLALNSFSPYLTAQPFAKAPGTVTDFSQSLDMAGTSARYIRFDKMTNFPGGDFNFVGLSEVQFYRDPDLKRTELGLGPTTYYFRKSFNFGGDPSTADLLLNTAANDGAIVYLNGVEVRRINVPAGPVNHTTLASGAAGHPTYSGFQPISAAALARGTNILSVEVHQAAASGDLDMIFGAELTAQVHPADPAQTLPGDLIFNELSGTQTSSALFIELVNRGTNPVNLAGYVIRRTGNLPDADFALGPGIVAAGGFVTLNQNTLSFGADAGDKLFLILPNGGIADAVEVHERPRARYPDGVGDWVTPNLFTPGSPNIHASETNLVINEIMYHAPSLPEVAAVIGTNIIIQFTNSWRYEQSGTDLGTAWRAPNYDDSAWPSGRALLYVSTNTLPIQKNTPLTLGPTTYYFRSSFVYTGTPAILSMTFRHVVDDGAVFYLNGNEIFRFLMPSGTIRYTNNSLGTIANAIIRNGSTINLTNLVLGTNVFAVEVHQAATSGNDVAFGMDVTAVVEAVPKIPYTASPEQWIELFNRGSNAVDLTGWRLDEAVDYRFPSNTIVPPGGYLVAANDPADLVARFPGISVVGPFAHRLSHRDGRVVIRNADDDIADVVHYFDDGRWPDMPDGGGSSLELRDPHADNSAGEAWAASDERSRSGWRTYSYRAVAAASPVGPDTQWHEFVMGLLGPGEVLLDDISVIENPSTTPAQMITNGNFTIGTNRWRIIGNHHGEVIDDPDLPGNKVLRLVATGPTEHMSNHGETTVVGNRDFVNGREYLVSFRAKWISGSRQFHTRLYFNRMAHTTILDGPSLHGTPGRQNSTFAANIGPTYQNLNHAPAVPGPFEPVTISVNAADPEGVVLTLFSRVNGGNWSSTEMAQAANGKYTATLGGQPAGTIVHFYVEGTDLLGAKSYFPAGGTNSRALYQVDDGLAATNGLHNVRLIALNEDTDKLLQTVNLMSNEREGCTVVYDEQEIFYDVGLRLKGSEHSRTTTPRLGFNIGFNSDHLLRGIHHTVALDRSESTGFGQREMLVHQMLNHAGGVPTKYHDLVQVMAPRPDYTGSAELQLARYSNVFLDDQIENGSDGMLFEYELIYQLNSTDTGTAEGNKVPAPDSVTGTSIRSLGDDKEAYRWNYLIKNNEDRDDYSRIIAFCKAMELSGAAFANAVTNVIDPNQWLRCVAVNVLTGAGDSYGGDGAQHNVQFYARPSDGLIMYFPHDMDAFFDANRGIFPNNELNKLVAIPAYARIYYSHLADVLTTTYNTGYMTRWAQHFGRLLPAQDFAGHLAFIGQRATVVMNQINSVVPAVSFAVTNNNGNDFAVSNNIVTLSGTAPLAVNTIQVNGVSYPVSWTSTTGWTLSVPLIGGANFLRLQGISGNGVVLGNAVDTITVTNNASGAPLPVVINEWMADNAAPFGFADPADGQFQDWFELFNPNTNAINLSGFFLTDNLSLPAKWQIPATTIIPAQGFLLVWADNQTGQNATSTNGDLHAAFQLNNGGEALGLFSPAGVAQHAFTFGAQFQNVSQGLYPDGDTNSVYFMTNATPRAPNTLAGPLKITDLTFSGGAVNLIWNTIPGHLYRLEFKDEIDDPAWTPIGNDVPALGSTAGASDPAPSLTHRFYRIIRVE